MAVLKNDHDSNDFTRISFELNLTKNDGFDYCPNREDNLNWIPFELKLCVGEEEKYIYPNEYSVTFSLMELKNLLANSKKLISNAKEKIKNHDRYFDDSELRLNFYTLERYFGMDIKYAYESLISMAIWINMIYSTKGKLYRFEKGFRFKVSIDDLDKFFDEIEEQLKGILLTWRNKN